MSGFTESLWWNARVHRLDLGLYSHPKEFGRNGVRNHVNSKGKNPLYRILRRGSNPHCCIPQDIESNTLPTKLFWPLYVHKDLFVVSPDVDGEVADLLVGLQDLELCLLDLLPLHLPSAGHLHVDQSAACLCLLNVHCVMTAAET